jgi:hypothetical protein
MKHRHVYSAPDLATANAAIRAAREAGIDDQDILLVARPDIELEAIPNDRKEADTDFLPAAMRGAGYGSVAGLIGSLIIVAATPLELSVLGAAGATAAGALLGGWVSGLVGSSLPDPIRRKFGAQIDAGCILVVIDGKEAPLAASDVRITAVGATMLPFDSPSAMS